MSSKKLLNIIGINLISNILYQILTVITIIYAINQIQLFNLSNVIYLLVLISFYFAMDIYIWKCENFNTSLLVFMINILILIYTYQRRQSAKNTLKSILNYYENFNNNKSNISNAVNKIQPHEELNTKMGDELGFDGEIKLPLPDDQSVSFIGKTEMPYIDNNKLDNNKLLNFPDNMNIFDESLDINNLVDRMKFNELVNKMVNKHRDNYVKMDKPLDDDLLNGISRNKIDPNGWDIRKYYPDCFPIDPDNYSGGKDFGYCTNINMPKRQNLELINNNKIEKMIK